MPKILFYIERNLHLPHLLPIHAELIKIPGMETGFCAPSFVLTSAHSPGWGLQQETIKRLKKIAPFYTSPKDFSPDITVIADACQFRLPPNCGPTVNVGHGLICKGTFYTPSTVSRRENLSTTLCVPGPWHRKRLESQVKIPIEVTGFIKTDSLVNGSFPDKKTFFDQQKLPANAHHILFAPTFNPELSSLPHILPVLPEIASRDITISIKLHTMTSPERIDACRQLSLNHEHIALLDEDSYAAMMHHCDLMLSDVSSIFVEFMLLDKPVVLFSSPTLSRFSKFDTTDIEYEVRKGCTELRRASALADTIQKELENPSTKSPIRRSFRKALDYGRDGNSAKRAAQTILETAEANKGTRKTNQERFLVVIDGQNASKDHIKKTRERVQLAGREQRMEVRAFCQEERQETNVYSEGLGLETLSGLLETNEWDYITFVQAGWMVPYNWAKHMTLHLKWEGENGLVRGLAQKAIAAQVIETQGTVSARGYGNVETAHYARTIGIGSTGIGICGKSPCVLTPLPLVQSVLAKNQTDSIQQLIAKLHAEAQKNEATILTALDVFLYPADTNDAPPRY